MINAIKKRAGKVVVNFDTGANESSPLTHLVVAKGERRTLRVMFALVQESWCLSPDFLGCALDKIWGAEKTCQISGRDWAPRKERRDALKGAVLYLDPRLVDPPVAMMNKLIRLAGGTVSSQLQTASFHVVPTALVSALPAAGGCVTCKVLSLAQLFDAIESASNLV